MYLFIYLSIYLSIFSYNKRRSMFVCVFDWFNGLPKPRKNQDGFFSGLPAGAAGRSTRTLEIGRVSGADAWGFFVVVP